MRLISVPLPVEIYLMCSISRGLIEVWKALLEKTDELSKRKLTMSELLLTQVSDVAKQQKRIKETNFKRVSFV